MNHRVKSLRLRFLLATIIASLLMQYIPPASVEAQTPDVDTPWTAVGNYAILGLNSVWLQTKSELHSGHVGVHHASTGQVLDPGAGWPQRDGWRWRYTPAEVSVGYKVAFHDPASLIAGDTVRLRSRASVFDVYCNEFKADRKASYGQIHSPLVLPLVSNLPSFPEINPGSVNIDVGWRESLELPAGEYGEVRLRGRSVLTLTGGTYHFANLKIGYRSQMVMTEPTEIRVAGRLYSGYRSMIGPASGSGLDGTDIVVFVAAGNGSAPPAMA